MNRPPKPHGPKFSLIGYRIDSMPFSRMFSILSETGVSETQFRNLLKLGHGIEIEGAEDPEIFYVVSEEQIDEFKRHGVTNPTLCQLLGSSECIGLNGTEVNAKFTAMKEADE